MKALFIIDMQEEYVGKERNKKSYNYEVNELINRINMKIQKYRDQGNHIVYIINKFFWQMNYSNFVNEINIVSDLIFKKKKSNCFSNPELKKFIQENEIDEIEIVGVDGNYCIAESAFAGNKMGITVRLSDSSIGASDDQKYAKTKQRLYKVGILFCE